MCRGRWPLLLVDLTAIANPAAVLDTVRVKMRPMHKSTQVVPFVHAPNLHPVAHPEWNAIGEVNVVGNQQRPAGANVDDEALMTGTVIIIRQKPPNEASNFDPAAIISLGVHPSEFNLP